MHTFGTRGIEILMFAIQVHNGIEYGDMQLICEVSNPTKPRRHA